MRQFGKQTLTIKGLWGIFSLLLSACFLVVPTAANTERFILDIYVTNPLSGSAIEGMDPVSYFTEPEPLVGTPQYEYEWEGVSWFFANEANKRVFMSPGNREAFLIEKAAMLNYALDNWTGLKVRLARR